MILIAKWVMVALAFLFAAYLIPGIEVASFYIALVLAFLWGLVNLIFRPILILLTLPITLLTLGLFTFVINGFLFWGLGTFVEGFEVENFWIAILGALLVSIVSALGNKLLSKTTSP